MGVLTDARAKPALPFAGTHRLVDFPLSNCANTGISDVWVVQQYEPHALEDHLANGRPWDLDRTNGGLLLLPPFEGREDQDRGGWHNGNADALWRHRALLAEAEAEVVLVLSADAVYAMDYAPLIREHVAFGADVTMAVTRVVCEDPGRFGVVQVGEDSRVRDFAYKPDEALGDLVTMEVFAYRPEALLDTLGALAAEGEKLADFGHGLLPALVDAGSAFAHRFDGYWRDVGTPTSYWQAHQDVLHGSLLESLSDRAWPIRGAAGTRFPAFVTGDAVVQDSLLSPGCHVAGRVVRSVIGPGVRVAEGAEVVDAVVLDEAEVGVGARVAHAVVDARVKIGPAAKVGAPRGSGDLTVLGAGAVVPEGKEVQAGDELAAAFP